jgi:hypothetical protein
MKILTVVLFALALTGSAMACSEDGSGGILPPNKLRIPVGAKMGDGGLTQTQFNAVIDKVEVLYAPIVSNMGGKLKIQRKWSDPTVNANADRQSAGPGGWNVNMYGGLARHQTITEDGFTLVLCHEIGHHLGGAPKIAGFGNSWASNEGQADYYATLKCLRRVFLNENNALALRKLKLKFKTDAPEALVKACGKSWPDKADKDICVRSGMAGASVSNLFAALGTETPSKFDTPDTKVVKKTDDAHPATQCRLDTYFEGALCEKALNEDVSQTDEVVGTCHGKNNDKVGLRPLCWFKPKI